MKLMLFQQAVEHLGVTDTETFKREVKRHRCGYQRGGIMKVDVEKFEAAVDAEFANDIENAPKPKTRSTGSDLGIIMARLSQDKKRREGKLKKIAAAQAATENAVNGYERSKFQREVRKLENELKLQDERHAADEKRRDAILSGSDADNGERDGDAQ